MGASLDAILADLKSPEEHIRARGVVQVITYVQTNLASSLPDDISRLWADVINKVIQPLTLPSANRWEKLGGIQCIGGLLNLDIEGSSEFTENQENYSKILRYIKNILPCDDFDIMLRAADIFGKLFVYGDPTIVDSVIEFEIQRLLDFMSRETAKSTEAERFGGLVGLNAFAGSVADMFLGYVDNVLRGLTVPLCDTRPRIRKQAGILLGTCINILRPDSDVSPDSPVGHILGFALNGLRSAGVASSGARSSSPGTALTTGGGGGGGQSISEVLLGALQIFENLYSARAMWMEPEYNEVCEMILRLQVHRDPNVRAAVVHVLPTCARYDFVRFTASYLRRTMRFYLDIWTKGSGDRSQVVWALGAIAGAVNIEIKSYIEEVLKIVKECLLKRGNPKAPASDKHLFGCIANLASAVGPHLLRQYDEMLDLLFAGAFNEHVTAALAVVVKEMPLLLKSVQTRLLNRICTVLSGQPYTVVGAPVIPAPPTAELQPITSTDVPTLILALDTLQTFNFTGHTFTRVIHSCVLPYLKHDDRDLRLKACETCCALLGGNDETKGKKKAVSPSSSTGEGAPGGGDKTVVHHQSNESVGFIAEVLQALIGVVIVDKDDQIRAEVLKGLDKDYDRHLAQVENVRLLFMVLNDDSYAVRIRAVKIIGRLANMTPGAIMPSLRKVLIQLLTELEYSTDVQRRVITAQVLTALLSATDRLIKPYAHSLLNVFLPKARDPQPVVSRHMIESIGLLGSVAGEDLVPFVGEILPLFTNALQDPQASNKKKEATLRALSQVCAHTGSVVDPLIQYPELFGVFRKLLVGDTVGIEMKRKVLQAMGVLGALDPYTRKRVPDSECKTAVKTASIQNAVKNIGAQPDIYFQEVVFKSLLDILKDPALLPHHTDVIKVVLQIFQQQGLKCVGFLPQIIPAFTAVARSADAGKHRDFYLQQLSRLVEIIGSHIRNYLQDVFELTRDLWEVHELRLPIVGLIEALAKAMAAEFKRFLPTVLPQLLMVFVDQYRSQATEVKVFQAMVAFGTGLEEYLTLCLPAFVSAIEKAGNGRMEAAKAAVKTLVHLAKITNVTEYTAKILKPLVISLGQVSGSGSEEYRSIAVEAIITLAVQLGGDFVVFMPTIQQVFDQNKLKFSRYQEMTEKLLRGERLPPIYNLLDITPNQPDPQADPKGLVPSQQHLKSAWTKYRFNGREDWPRWFKTFSLELMRQSTAPAIRACAPLSDVYPPLAKSLLNAAFYSCWTELSERNQESVVTAITEALTQSKNQDLMLTLLSLIEFMEHEDRELPIDTTVLGVAAVVVNAFAKALHYTELEYHTKPTDEVTEHLIGTYAKLQRHDAAFGLLKISEKGDRDRVRNPRDRPHRLEKAQTTFWYEKLGKWDDALSQYELQLLNQPTSESAAFGRMRCWYALGQWETLQGTIDQEMNHVGGEQFQELAQMGATCAWVLGHWKRMEDYVTNMAQSPDTAFFQAILHVHHNQFNSAQLRIQIARDSLEREFHAEEEYDRSYPALVRVQLLSELEEIIAYKEHSDQPEWQAAMKKTWSKRLLGCQRDPEVWQKVLQLRTLVLQPREDIESWIKYAELCRKAGRLQASRSIMEILFKEDSETDAQHSPALAYAHVKLMWELEEDPREKTLQHLTTFCIDFARSVGFADSNEVIQGNRDLIEKSRHLLAKANMKQGDWRKKLAGQWTPALIGDVTACYRMGTMFNPRSYRAWHTWAMCNLDIINHLEREEEIHNDEPQQARVLIDHIVAAIEGFFQSISLQPENTLQDSLRLLTLWFKFGGADQVSEIVRAGLEAVPVDTWLQVIPQLIARIQTSSPNIQTTIDSLLTDVGKAHPQALIYPLTVASKSTNIVRQRAAGAVMSTLRQHSQHLVEQALMVSEELIRVAILWHEMWHEYLEEASRLYFNDKNPEGMIDYLAPLHAALERGAETQREMSFAQAHGKDLQEAKQACERWRISHDVSEMDKAWDIYYNVFRKIEKRLPQLTTLDLQYVSPRLLHAENLELAVPGTYRSGNPVIPITKFGAKLSVIASKQRPRRLSVIGGDGKEYQYCLKGHEDLRQDERVMQVFGLVNTLLAASEESFMRQLHIQGYAVIPLAPNVGLLQWVLNSDTLHVLVQEYRNARKIHLQIEYRLMLQMAPDYVNLTMLQKLEVFQYALDNTTGQDLYRVLWLTSANSEAWLERRTTYTRSLAVSSMVGHIMGLGDRHPANLLVDRVTGQVVHIDFGDCFEIAMHREKFPERIPFRLTRMLTQAMEVSGIEGSFRTTSEITMKVMRENKESLMAVLEAFVYDPLITWRLTQTQEQQHRGREGEEQTRFGTFAVGANRARPKANENEIFEEVGDHSAKALDHRNERAVQAYTRVQQKLTGKDFKPDTELSVPEQVDRLIQQATAVENLCQCFPGWCPFW